MSRKLESVLLLEDVPANAGVVQMALSAVSGIKVHHALTGEDALDMFATLRPDLCLFDLVLPGMDGVMTMQHLPESANVPVVFLTAWADTAKAESLIRAGATDVITKPFDVMKLGNRLERAYQRYHRGGTLGAVVGL